MRELYHCVKTFAKFSWSFKHIFQKSSSSVVNTEKLSKYHIVHSPHRAYTWCSWIIFFISLNIFFVWLTGTLTRLPHIVICTQNLKILNSWETRVSTLIVTIIKGPKRFENTEKLCRFTEPKYLIALMFCRDESSQIWSFLSQVVCQS